MIYTNSFLIEFTDKTKVLLDPYSFPKPLSFKIHKVKEDETLFDIANEYFEDTRYWVLIAEFNFEEFTTPLIIPMGTELKIPR